ALPIVAAPQNSPPPNILLIVVDSLSYAATTGNNMPFLSSLASRDVSFTHAYSTNDAENGIHDQLRHAGYHTFAIVANNLKPVVHGFNDLRQAGDITRATLFEAMIEAME